MISMQYDPKKKRAVYTFTNGRSLTVGNLSEEKAKAFLEQDAPEFEKRDCRMSSVGGHLVREDGSDG